MDDMAPPLDADLASGRRAGGDDAPARDRCWHGGTGGPARLIAPPASMLFRGSYAATAAILQEWHPSARSGKPPGRRSHDTALALGRWRTAC
jgi:hypothetical protein